jgi:alkanesulfonate monooxygenase SsuD/methylene tetrahydromethanopterin reductase-like flavin-dependent oxidoreductase (luciferase family)
MLVPPLTVLQFDMRAAPFCPDSSSERYNACIEMVKWTDQHNITVVGFSEHHNTADGFISSPLMMAMAAATASQQVAIAVSALQLPLHDPLRVAEDIAVLDLISNGRFVVTLGLGYRELEYQTFGVPWESRGKIFDEKLAVLLQALGGEEFEYQGARVKLNPVPARHPGSFLMVGGNSPAAARRAARFKLLFAPAIDDPALQVVYEQECKKHGFDRGAVIFPREPSLTLIAEDPDRAWAEVGQFLLYDAVSYAGWKHNSRRAYAESSATTLEDLRAEGKYAILTPDQAAEKMAEKGSINLAPLCGGVPIEFGWSSLKLFNEKVVPIYQNAVNQ